MRELATCVAILALGAAPALADTLQEVTSKGVVMSVQGMDVEVIYTPDGKFSALDGQVTGTWKIVGEKLCTTSNYSPDETCVAYPKGKKSGDTFALANEQGSVSVRIK